MSAPNESTPYLPKQLHDALLPLHDPGGVNEERVFHFAEAIGLPPANHIIYSSHDTAQVKHISERHGLTINDDILARSGGIFYGSHNLALAKNDYGSRNTELNTVHEAAHNRVPAPRYSAPLTFRQRMGWKGFKKYVIDNGVVANVEDEYFSGFCGEYRGIMTEEMWATMIEGGYNQVVLSQDQMSVTNFVNAAPDLYPEKYDHKKGGSYMFGAIALEIICDANPTVLDPMFDSRKNHESMYDVAREIDKIDRGLFLELHNTYIERDETWDFQKFHQGYERVLQAVGVNPHHKESVNNTLKAMHDRKVVSTYISSLMDRYSRQTGYNFVIEPPVNSARSNTTAP